MSVAKPIIAISVAAALDGFRKGSTHPARSAPNVRGESVVDNKPREERVNKLIVPAIMVAAAWCRIKELCCRSDGLPLAPSVCGKVANTRLWLPEML